MPTAGYLEVSIWFLSDQGACSNREATAVALQLRQSKADQFGWGQVRIQHAIGQTICPVEALRSHARENPICLTFPMHVRVEGTGGRSGRYLAVAARGGVGPGVPP